MNDDEIYCAYCAQPGHEVEWCPWYDEDYEELT